MVRSTGTAGDDVGSRDDSFWAQFLGIKPTDWEKPGISYRAHVGLRGYQGLWCFRRKDRVVVSAPSGWVDRTQRILSCWATDRFTDPSSLAEAFGADFDRAIGPAFQGCLHPAGFAHRSMPHVRTLVPADSDSVAVFKTECGTSEWRNSALDEAASWRHAYFDQGQITALAGYRSRGEDVGDPCILTHPHFRGGGRGAAVARAVVADAVSNGKLLLYQTLESNEAALRIAFSLGYHRYANHVAVRLKTCG
jgi:GNAT superfamily N-acetyltransferase